MSELEERRLVNGAQGDAALGKIRQSLRVVPLGGSGQEIRHQIVLGAWIFLLPQLHHLNSGAFKKSHMHRPPSLLCLEKGAAL